jgi:hypothetical protein
MANERNAASASPSSTKVRFDDKIDEGKQTWRGSRRFEVLPAGQVLKYKSGPTEDKAET